MYCPSECKSDFPPKEFLSLSLFQGVWCWPWWSSLQGWAEKHGGCTLRGLEGQPHWWYTGKFCLYIHFGACKSHQQEKMEWIKLLKRSIIKWFALTSSCYIMLLKISVVKSTKLGREFALENLINWMYYKYLTKISYTLLLLGHWVVFDSFATPWL